MLRRLAELSDLPVPAVFHADDTLLLMDYIESGGRLDDGAQVHAAELLAALHEVRGEAFGFERDTRIGGLPQPNPKTARWLDFFRDRRLLHMGREALRAKRLPDLLMGRLETLAGRLATWIVEPAYPALLHGDLWGGNILAYRGRVVSFVDPAIYYGDPEIELAFGTLFGTFGPPFFARYGELRPIRGALAMCLAARGQARSFVLPAQSAAEAALVGGAAILPAQSLLQVCAHLNGQTTLASFTGAPMAAAPDYPDLADVKGQAQAKRALEVAAAGGHSLLMTGPPGTGKSMLAARFPGLLPPMGEEEALESAALHSLNGGFRLEQWMQRPFQAPHHTASAASLVGGGSNPRPGEISLAHHGVLFLDELPEFERRVLEALREPLESGHIRVARAAHRVDYPAQFQLVAAMNPCPCGHLGEARCRCTPDQVARYRSKLSGPLLDRIDLHIEVPALVEDELQGRADGESSATVRARVSAARAAQRARQGKPNNRLATKDIDKLCAPDEAGAQLLKQAIARLNLSARAYHRVLKVARTIADLAGAERVTSAHVAEAIHYRRGAGLTFSSGITPAHAALAFTETSF